MDASDWVSGQYGRALDFDGSNDYATTNLTNTGGAYFSAFCWWRRTAAASAVQAIGQYTTGTNKRAWTILSANTNWIPLDRPTGKEFGVTISSNGTIDNGQHKAGFVRRDISDGLWYHIGFTFTPNQLEMFINGVSQAITYQQNDAISSIFKTTDSNVAIGALNANTTPAGFFNGQLDDLRVYDRALSYAEIRLLSSEPGIGFKPAKKLSRFSTRYTYKPPKAKVFEGVRVRDHDYASLREGLVGAWCPSLPNGGSGNTLPDQSGRGNHGTLTNMGPEDWVSGQYGRALDFDGVNDCIPVGLPFGPTSSGVKTISLWCYFRSSADSYLVTNYDASSNGFSVLLNSDRTIGIARTGATNNIRTTASVALSNWTHIFVQIDATGVIWINGIESARGSMLSELTSTNNVRTSGRWVTANSGSAALLNAQIDDIRFFNRALTESEIRLLASRRGIGLQPSPTRFIAREKKTGLRRKILTGQT